MDLKVMKEQLQPFGNIHLFPLRNERLHNPGDHVDTFLSFLQRQVNFGYWRLLGEISIGFSKHNLRQVWCAPRAAEHCKSHWCLVFEQRFTEISGSPTKTGIEWYEDGDRDPTHDITYPVKTDPGLKELKNCALQFEPRGNTTEHWLCPCALWVSTVIREYTQKGYVTGISSSGISAENLHLKLVYSSLGI
ncbi:hypothetical protein BDV33DRAFT_184014 [Aspergillus novoparasiticus]|uniref:Uncharacterized protein n=1 Tax=Aspergillus novoparasiticus TaxID=986946 RepID=A0A5N6E865_9EURO|nr:hypothetical protein BDV33DRAFT_184014 [Aspergillus novoparasiticus]